MAEVEPTVVEVPGPRIRLEESGKVRSDLLALIESGKDHLVLDFEDVDFVDSSFLGLLIVVLKRATATGGDVRICCLRPQLINIFTLMRLDRLFEIHDTRQAAIDSYK